MYTPVRYPPKVPQVPDESRLNGEESPLKLRCYAFGSGESWEAICVDFDIAVFGSSPVEVQSSLETGIELYLEEAAEATPEDRQYLLTRRSPWFVRAKLRFWVWTANLFAGVREFRKFTLQPQLPALR